MNFLSQNKLTLLALVLIVSGIFWYSFSGTPDTAILSTQSPDGPGSADKELVATLLTLRAVSLSGTILSDQSFRGLKDFSTQIIQEDVGRPDPFAPLQQGSLSPATPEDSGNSTLFKAVSP